MGNKYNKSAKDLAWDRERAKYGNQIQKLKTELRQKDVHIRELSEQIGELESKCESLQDWVNRLLDYTNMSEEDMKTIIQKDKDSAEAIHMMKGLLGFASGIGHF